MKLDWTQRRIKQFIDRQKAYESIGEKIAQLNERKLGAYIRAFTLTTEQKFDKYVDIGGQPQKLRRAQLEEKRMLESGYTKAIYNAVYGFVCEVREYIPAYAKTARKLSPKITAEEIERLDRLVQKLHKYEQLAKTDEIEADLTDFLIQQTKEEIYDLLLEIQGR